MKKIIIASAIAFFIIGCGGSEPVSTPLTPASSEAGSTPTGNPTSSVTAVTCPSEPQDCGDECPPPIPSAIASC